MDTHIDVLIFQARDRLAGLGYAPGTIERYQATWNKVRRWCSEQGVECFTADHEERLVEDMGLAEDVLSPKNRSLLRHVRTLRSLGEGGGLPPFSRAAPKEVPDRFQNVFHAYVSYLDQRGLARSTRRGQVSVIRTFLKGLRVEGFDDLTMADVTAHVEACSSMAIRTRAAILYNIRSFTRWAASEELCSPAVAAAMPIIPGHKHSSLPSAYVASEVAAMVGATGEECPRRDRAMLLLASVLGMRAGDIRTLRLGEIDWRVPEVRFTQAKTGIPLRLPLPDEVMLALADYLRDERPKSVNDHVFLHHRAPHDSFERTTNSFHYVATGAFERASVNTGGKHHGMHSLRHSVATNMLSDGATYPVISVKSILVVYGTSW